MGRDYRWNDPDSVSAIYLNYPLEVTPNLTSFYLDPRTNLTDVISQGYISAMGLLVSKPFKSLLTQYTVQDYELHPATVVHQGQMYCYYWLHLILEVEDRIDFGRSQFVVIRPQKRPSPIDIRDPADLRAKRIELVTSMGGELRAKSLVFQQKTPHFDLFCLRMTGFVFHISDRLAADLSAHELTGFKIEPIEVTVDFEY